ncbi:MAG: OsmC family protein [Bacteroidetes bacterium]|nr:OsmC family protein [Bacteroidota bacterium]
MQSGRCRLPTNRIFMGHVIAKLEKQEADFHFRAFNTAGQFVDIDDATAYEDGKGNGVGPMQLVVMAIGGCSSVDVVSILKKGRQDITSMTVEVDGFKPDGVSPSIYETIELHFKLEGNLDPARVKRAIELSLGKYCSVSRILEKSAQISYRYTVNGTDHGGATFD